MLLNSKRIKTPLGVMVAHADDNFIRSFHFERELTHDYGNSNLLDWLCEEVSYYFQGKLQKFTVPFIFSGTPFQEAVWKLLLNIPYGQRLSYAGVAEALHNPKAYRAVGGACSLNELLLIIPCHRVIQKNGKIGGFMGRIDTDFKKHLLELESHFV